MTPRATTFRPALAAFIIVILVAAPQARQAQQPAQFAPTAAPGAGSRMSAAGTTDIDLLVGRSTIVNVGSPIARVSLTVPDIADAMVTAPGQLLIHGKAPGTISLFVWDRGGAITTYEVKVRRDLSALVEQVKQLFPGEPITIIGSGKDVVISGTVSSQYVVDKAANVAAGYVDKAENVVNLLKQQEGVASNQVMLRVRFAEVSRSAVQELGASFFTGPTGYKNWIARATTQQFTAPDFSELSRTGTLTGDLTAASGKYSLSDFLNLFVFNNKYNIGTVVKALQDKGLFQSLAEPNLIATNGKEASFLAGGEFPIPVVQGGNGSNSVTVQFKEFGIRLHFTPTVLGGDLINLKVTPEVSALDFANAVIVNGFRIPALTTRRTDTEVELRDGQTFAIAGLLNNSVTDSMRKIPGIGDIPILGWLFKSKAMQKNQTELVVMITPTIIRRGQMGVSEGLPAPIVPFMGAPEHTQPTPAPYVGSPRFPSTQPSPKGAAATQPSEKAPVAAAAPNAAPLQTPKPVTRPIESSKPVALAAAPSSTRATIPAPAAKAAPAPAPKVDARALEQKRETDKKFAEAAAKLKAAEDLRKAEEDRVGKKKADEDKRAADKLAKERALRDAEVAKRNAEVARRKAEEDQRRDRSLADAAARLKAAQDAYQAEVDKTKGSQK
ncbi:MAG: pilus assembly protein CpaC [Acidobacteriota bacterium]|jgi:pilus assembly protein CpaC